MTPFELTVLRAEAGEIKVPVVFGANNSILGYFQYQLATHHFNLKLMARGLKFRGIKLKDLKNYYGLKGRSAVDCLKEFEAIKEKFGNRPVEN
jgi:hypothetical protein